MPRFSSVFLIFVTQIGALFSSNQEELKAGQPYGIAVIGTGYVGLTIGACLAEFGNRVVCCDIDQNKIASLQQGRIPIHEIGLQEIVDKNRQEKRLFFSGDVEQSIRNNEILFIAAGTPLNENGEENSNALYTTAKLIGENLNGHKIIYVKSTAMLGLIRKFAALIRQHNQGQFDFDIAYTPEFLREGSSVEDFCHPERIVIGSESEKANLTFCQILEPLYKKKIPFLFTSIESAEMIKYASNSFLAVKIAFINEIANLCDRNGADIADVAAALALDSRIGPKFLKPGPGYGGYCLSKDTITLVQDAQKLGVDLKIVQAAVEANKIQQQIVLQKLYKLLDFEVNNKTIAILGLSFKENTDDVRCSPALKVIEELLKKGALINVFDPCAMKNLKKIYPQIRYWNSPYDAVKGTDATLLLTGWKEFENMDFDKIHQLMKQPNIVDARNLIALETLKKFGFKYENIGRSNLEKKNRIK